MLIKEITKNSRETIVVSIDEFKSKEFVNLRVNFLNEEGKLCPTKKGIALSEKVLPDVIESLITALEQLKKNGD